MEEDSMTRKEELVEIIEKTGNQNDVKARKLIEMICFQEERLDYYGSLPHFKVDAKNPERQKELPALNDYNKTAREYRENLRLLFRLTGDMGESEEESPLRKWAKSRNDS